MATDKLDQHNAEIFITKIAAAKRQLDAAIRMIFHDEDELAIHTVAAAGYRIVRDLRKKRGQHEFPHEVLLRGIFELAKDLLDEDLEGKHPADIVEYAKSDSMVKHMADLIATARKEVGRDVLWTEFKFNTPDSGHYWRETQRGANFLKHADQDSASTISVSKLNTDYLLMKAISSYVTLTHQQTVEMEVYYVYRMSLNENPDHFKELSRPLFDYLQKLDRGSWRKGCLDLIGALKTDDFSFQVPSFIYHLSRDAVYITFSEAPVKESRYAADYDVEDSIKIDLDSIGRFVGICLFNASAHLPSEVLGVIPRFRGPILGEA